MQLFARILSALLLITALAFGQNAYSGTCKLKDENTLYLKGSTDQKMLACVEKYADQPVTQVILKSRGGKVSTALQIGDILSGFDAHMEVKSECNSSCANYFLPVARSVTLRKNAVIILHGSIDPGFVIKMKGESSDRMEEWRELVQLQKAYAARHNIPRGWLMYREDYSVGMAALRPHIAGELGWPEDYALARGRAGGSLVMNYFLVEPLFAQSCLPQIEFEGFKEAAIGKAEKEPRYRQKLIKQNIISTGTWSCSGWADAAEQNRDNLRAQPPSE